MVRLLFCGGYQLPQTSLLLYDFAPWRGLLVRDNKLAVGRLINVVILGLALCNHGETKKRAKQNARFKIVTRLGRVTF
jgi:hypothetical protein